MRFLFASLLLAPLGLMAQTIAYTWPNQPCVQMLHCDSGCSACNVPDMESPLLVGSNLSAVGISVCPRPTGGADNALDTYGWPMQPLPDHRLVLSGMALVPVSLDSMVIAHGADADGPQRLEVSLAMNGGPAVVVADVQVPAMGATTLADLGAVLPGAGQAFGTYQLTLRAYLGNGGSWSLDAVRLVFSEQAIATSLPELVQEQGLRQMPRTDLLGRSVDGARGGGHLVGRSVIVMP